MDHLTRCGVIAGTQGKAKGPAMPELAISAEKVAFIIEKAREFDVKQADSDPDSGSNATDDDAVDWDDLRARAVEARAEYRSPRRETAHYLLGEPMLGDLLADGLDEFGVDWTEGGLVADSSSPSQRDEDEITKQR
jgi:hypothetical protein